MTLTGSLSKMPVSLAEPVNYQLRVGDQQLPLNALLGDTLKLAYSGEIFCCHCGRKTSKSFNQGYCFPCFKRLAQCDSCITSPEKCHYFAGTCREPDWADQHCMRDHIVYLANSSGIKVGITRASQLPTRWIDQGAVQALPLFRVSNRLQSGLLEIVFKQHVADRTNWRAMLKGANERVDLAQARDRLLGECAGEVSELQQRFGLQAIQPIEQAEEVAIEYPVLAFPDKVVSHNLDKTPVLEGTLLGIKGQYLIFDTAVINIRKYTGYQVTVST